VDGRRVIAFTERLLGRRITSLLASGADLWVGTDAGLVLWNGTAITGDRVPSSLRRAQVLTMWADRRSNLWFGTRSGLVRLNGDGASALDSFDHNSGGVNALFEDREGDLWVGGSRCIERWRDGIFSTYGKAEGLPSDQGGPIYADSEGRTWFAPREGGLYWLSRGRATPIAAAGLGTDVIYAIHGNGGDLWIGRQRGGLTHLRYREGRLVADTFTQADGLAGVY